MTKKTEQIGYATTDFDYKNCYDGNNMIDDKQDPETAISFKKDDKLPEELMLRLLELNPEHVRLEPKKETASPKVIKTVIKKELALSDLPGVGAATAEKLQEAGYSTLMSIAVATPGELTEAAGVGEAMARKIINTARNNLDMGFISGEELLKRRESVIKITTGSKAFDKLIDGGFESGAITECYGMFGSGKCQSKDTRVLYFNSSKPHLETMEAIYEKYKSKFGERPEDCGYVVDVPPVEVMGFKGNKLEKVKAEFLYKEKVQKLYEVTTSRGRKLRLTGSHKLLSFNGGLQWIPSATLKEGNAIACPKKIECEGECQYDEDDAYFLGLFAAEGSRHPCITTGSELLRDWVKEYAKTRFGFDPAVYEDTRREKAVYTIHLRNASKKVLGELADCTAGTKFVPQELLQAQEPIAASFLAGYIDGDGHYAKKGFEATTKSETLATDLSYLFLRIGIATTVKEKIVDGDKFWRVSVTSENSEKLNLLPGKIKKSNYKPLNTKYGYPKNITTYLRNSYKQTLGGNRGRLRKAIGKSAYGGKMFYEYLTKSAVSENSINEKTLQEMYLTFLQEKENIKHATELAQDLEKLDKDSFKQMHRLIPFAFNKLGKELGLSKPAMNNYTARGLPKHGKSKMPLLKKLLTDRLTEIDLQLDHTLATIKNVAYFNWDTIESVKEIEYNDYVYDFVVPEGHCFVGGNIPTMMHNTVMAHNLAVNAQLPKEQGGADGSVVWIDTENTFRPERIKQMAEARGLDCTKLLKNIYVVRAFNSDHQMLVAEKIEELITKDKIPVKLVIVDSLMAHFRAEFCGRGTLADRQQKLNKHMHALMKVADTQNLCVYVTNQVMSKPDVFFGDPTAAIGGNIVGHNSTTRLYLRRGKAGTRVAKLVDSPHLPDGECCFNITEQGIEDVE